MSAIEYTIDNGGAADFSADATRPGDLDSSGRCRAFRFMPSARARRYSGHGALRPGPPHAKVSLRITGGSIAAAANMFASVSTPNLIILETGTEPKLLLSELAPLAKSATRARRSSSSAVTTISRSIAS